MKIRKFRMVSLAGRSVRLAGREYDLFMVLKQANGEWMTAEEIERLVTDENLEHNPGHWTRAYVQRLRDSLREQGLAGTVIIDSAYGKGYRLLDYTETRQLPGGEIVEGIEVARSKDGN